jgi:hypothetical protein
MIAKGKAETSANDIRPLILNCIHVYNVWAQQFSRSMTGPKIQNEIILVAIKNFQDFRGIRMRRSSFGKSKAGGSSFTQKMRSLASERYARSALDANHFLACPAKW